MRPAHKHIKDATLPKVKDHHFSDWLIPWLFFMSLSNTNFYKQKQEGVPEAWEDFKKFCP